MDSLGGAARQRGEGGRCLGRRPPSRRLFENTLEVLDQPSARDITKSEREYNTQQSVAIDRWLGASWIGVLPKIQF